MAKGGLSKQVNLLFSQPWSDHLCQKLSFKTRADACADFVIPVDWGLQDTSPEREGSCSFLPSVRWEGHLFRRDSSEALGPLCHMYGGAKPPCTSLHTWDTLSQWTWAEAGAQTPHSVRGGVGLQPRHSTNVWDRCICRTFQISCNVQLDLTCYQPKYNHTTSWPGQKSWCKLFLSCVAHPTLIPEFASPSETLIQVFVFLRNLQKVSSLKICIKTNPLEK